MLLLTASKWKKKILIPTPISKKKENVPDEDKIHIDGM